MRSFNKRHYTITDVLRHLDELPPKEECLYQLKSGVWAFICKDEQGQYFRRPK